MDNEDDDEAVAALLALGSRLEWLDGVPGRHIINRPADGGKRYDLLFQSDVGWWFIHDDKGDGTFTWRRTLPEAKRACEWHRATGRWAQRPRESTLDWVAHEPIASSRNLVAGSVGRNVAYLISQTDLTPSATTKWWVWVTRHRCEQGAHGPVTILPNRESDVSLCATGKQYRLCDSLAHAKAVCEQHHQTGRWGTERVVEKAERTW